MQEFALDGTLHSVNLKFESMLRISLFFSLAEPLAMKFVRREISIGVMEPRQPPRPLRT
jgi:hypothetical protein